MPINNPSSWPSRVAVAIIASVAFFIALYMGLYQWRLIDFVWDPLFGKGTMDVLDSNVSHEMRRIVPLPDAVLGALSYLGDVIFAIGGSIRRWQDRPWLVILFGLDVIPLGIVSITLVVLQGTVVHQWCFLCLCTALISLILIFLAFDEVRASVLYLYAIWKKSKSFSVLWNSFWGNPSKEAYEAGIEILERRSKN